jgi:hypothetical protein
MLIKGERSMNDILTMLPEGVMILDSDLSTVRFVNKACINILEDNLEEDSSLLRARN